MVVRLPHQHVELTSRNVLTAGLTCRWASKHAQPDALTREFIIAPQQAAAADTVAPAPTGSALAVGAPEEAADSDTAANGTSAAYYEQPASRGAVVAAPPPPGEAQQAEDATWAAGGGATLQRSSETAAAAAASQPAVELAQHLRGEAAAAPAPSDAAWLDGQAGSAQIAPAQNSVAAAAVAATVSTNWEERNSEKGDQPRETVELPVQTALPNNINFLDKTVQGDLRSDLAHVQADCVGLAISQSCQLLKAACCSYSMYCRVCAEPIAVRVLIRPW